MQPVFCLQWDGEIQTKYNMQNVFLNLSRNAKENIMKQFFLLKKKKCSSYSPCFNTVNMKAEVKNASNTSELLI